jgi:predicted site-specific integrase-resolvase
MAFIAEHINSDEVAKLLGVRRLTVQKWARLGRLAEVCVSGPNIDGHHSYIFHRERLIHWREARLTFGEAAKLLGISSASLHRWVEQKKIIPLDDMGAKQRWFSKQTIVELSEREV